LQAVWYNATRITGRQERWILFAAQKSLKQKVFLFVEQKNDTTGASWQKNCSNTNTDMKNSRKFEGKKDQNV
jgi:hypothetical protein